MSEPELERLRGALSDRYAFEAILGRGAFATVYLVRNLKLKRREALKILAAAQHANPDYAARFVAEATTVASLDHPNIVQVYDYGDVEGTLWYSMQWVEGPTLWAERQARRRLDAVTALRIFVPLLDALELSHRRGVIHRDVKPANILLSQQGRPFLTDFGIAKNPDSGLLTVADKILGTPAYMSPEQAEGKVLDGRSDLYSLALVLYECLCGRQPFEAAADEPLALLVQRTQREPKPIREYLPELDPELATILMQALARRREQRFSSAEAFRRPLAKLLGDEESLPPLVLKAPPPAAQWLASATTEVPAAPAGARDLGTSPLTISVGASTPSILPGSRARRVKSKRSWIPLAAASALAAASILGLSWARSRTTTSTPPPVPSATASSPANDAGPVVSRPPEDGLPSSSTPALTEPAQPAAQKAPAPRREQPGETPAAAPAEVVRRAVTFPRLLEQPSPELDATQQAACAGLSVILSVKVGEDGRVTETRSLRPAPVECRNAAEAAARRYLFQPAADAAGQPVAASTTISVEFGEVSP